MQRGTASVGMDRAVYIQGEASIVGPKEAEGPLGALFDEIDSDGTCGKENWEQAESALQQRAAQLGMEKAGLTAADIRYVIAGDLLGQSIASTFGIQSFGCPVIGMYGACSTMGLTMETGAMLAAGGFAQHVLCVTSSHYASAERQFRFPSDYGNQRPLSAQWTVTGSAAVILGTEKPHCRSKDPQEEACVCVTGVTTGRIVDYGITDSMNMGAAMAPAACDTILRNLTDFERTPQYYDKIVTGDLGKVGSRLLCDLLKEKGMDIEDRHMDCGLEIYDDRQQDTHAGGSGCGCSAVVLAAYILPLMRRGNWKRVLFVPTGALLSKTSFNEGETIPGVAHAVVLETEKGEQ